MNNDELIPHLNDLIATSLDGEHGYRTAAEHVRNTQLEAMFGEYAHQRQQFAKQLQAEVTRLGGTPAETGTVAAAMHRGWLDLKSAFTAGGPAALIAACETGEDSAVAAFERVADLPLTGEIRTVVEKQYHAVKEAHARLIHLKKEAEHGVEFQDNVHTDKGSRERLP